MTAEHPFAPFIRTLGRGKKGQRSLSRAEARAAMALMLKGEVEPAQLGAFLMLLRVKEETPEEVAGFVEALRERLRPPEASPQVSIDWSSYAGKRRHLPWFVLAALLLAENGYPVFMHGMRRDDERLYTPDVLKVLGIPLADSLEDAARRIEASGFAYLDIERFSPHLHKYITLRSVLGLRSPAHTIARLLNPFGAHLMLQGIFHPGYAAIHQKAAWLLGQDHAAVFKGEGGEIERDPDKPVTVFGVGGGEAYLEEWPALFTGPRHLKEPRLDLRHLHAVWQGTEHNEYGEAAVIGTVAIALKAVGAVAGQDDAIVLAWEWWSRRMSRQAA